MPVQEGYITEAVWQWNAHAGIALSCKREESPAIQVSYKEGITEIFVWYTGHDAPLILRAPAQKGEEIRFICRPYRIELWTEQGLMDEEWPCGEACFTADMLRPYGEITPIPAHYTLPRSVCGTFTGGEGWRPGTPDGGVFVGDCMPYTWNGRYHVLYLKDRRHHCSKWGLGAHQWEHISTEDFHEWQIHPMAVPIDNPGEGSICTGSWIECGERQYLYYTVRRTGGEPAPVCRSVSTDGYRFEKDRSFCFTLGERYHRASARDPKVIRAEDGWHMLVTTSDLSLDRGVLAHLVSRDGEQWEERDSIYVSPDRDQPECPDYFFYNGWYYLIFSHHGTAQYRYSDKPFSDWRIPDEPRIPCESVPKAAIFDGKLIFTGFRRINGYAGTLTFREAFTAADGQLRFTEKIKNR